MKKALVLLVVGLGLAGCNNGALTAAAIASPTPTPEPTATPADNQPPVAQIAGTTSYAPLATATFDGGNSYDPDGTIATFAWAIVARPAGSVSTLQPGATPALTSLFVDLAGDYTIELTVTDNQGATGSQQLNFSAVPSQDLHVEATWAAQYTKTDMDLHLINKTQTPASGAFWDYTYDCMWLTCKTADGENLDWWQSGFTPDNPTLDIDNISESVPENINIVTPHNGDYEINVHYYSSHTGSDIPVDLTVNVYLGGQLVWTGQKTLTTTDQVWKAATIHWANGTGTVTPFAAPNDVFMTTH